MNPEFPGSSEDMEARITALLLGELPPDQVEAVRAAMARDPDLARLHDRLKRTVDLVKAASEQPAELAGAAAADPLRLSEERREKLLAQFKTVNPAVFASPRRRQPSWFVPVAAAAVLMVLGALVAVFLFPSLERRAFRSSLSRGELSEELAVHPGDARTWSFHASDDSKVSYGVSGLSPNSTYKYKLEDREVQVRPRSSEPEREELARRQIRDGQMLFENAAKDRKPEETIRARLLEVRGKIEQAGKPVTTPPPMELAKVPQLAQEMPAVDFAPAPTAAAEPPMRQNERGFQAGAFISKGAAVASADTAQTEEKYQLGWNNYSSPSALMSTEILKKPEGLRNEGRSVPGQAGFGGGGFGAVSVPPQPGQTHDYYSYAITDGDKNWYAKDQRDRTLERWDTDVAARGDFFKLSVLGDAPVLGKDLRNKEAKEKVAPVSGIVLPSVSAGETVNPVTTAFNDDLGLASSMTSPNQMDAKKLAEVRLELESATTTPAVPSTPSSIDSLGRAEASGSLDLITNASEGQLFRRHFGLARLNSSSVILPESEVTTPRVPAKAGPPTEVVKPLLSLRNAGNASNMPSRSLRGTPAPRPKISMRVTPSASASSRQPGGMPAPAKEPQDTPALRPATPPPIPQPEVLAAENPFSTFSLNVADVSFKLAAASLEQGRMPDPGTIRSEEFINAFDYRDPEAAAGVPFAFAWERARYPFAHNRDLLRFSLKTAAQGRAANTPLNLVLLLDNSGSMERADRVSIRLEAIRVLAGKLQPQDKLSLITFARNAQLRIDGARGPQAGSAAQEAANLTPEGGTNLEEAMRLGYETAFRHYVPGGVNRVILLTDGAANLGSTDAETLKPMVEHNRRQGVAFDCFGIGWEGYNDELLEVLSRNGDGRYGFVNSPEEASSEFAAKLAGALQVAASDVKVQVEFDPARVSLYRQIGYAKHQLTKEQFRDNTVDAAEIAAAESGNALYLIELLPQGTGPVATVRVRYKSPATGQYSEMEWTVPYTGTAAPLEQAGPAIKLAAVAAAFSEWLAGNPYAGEVTPDHLLALMIGVKESYGIDPRPVKLEMMVRQAKSISGR